MVGFRQFIGIFVMVFGLLFMVSWYSIASPFLDFSGVPFVGNMLHAVIAIMGGGLFVILGTKIFCSNL